MTIVSWVDAARHDRPRLQAFQCTTPRRRQGGRTLAHPRPWEFEVQAWIRARTPPAGSGELMRLGVAADGSVEAVGALALVSADSDYALVKLQAVAVTVGARGKGGAVADAALLHVLEAAYELGSGAESQQTIAIAWIHPRNEASRRMVARHQFVRAGTVDGYEDWQLILTV